MNNAIDNVIYDTNSSYNSLGKGRILSSTELENMLKYLNTLSSSVENYITNTQKVIKTFNNQNIVQSFYSSGRFGTKQRQKLEKISNALQRYWNVIENGNISMINQTRKFIERSLENVSGGHDAYITDTGDKVETAIFSYSTNDNVSSTNNFNVTNENASSTKNFSSSHVNASSTNNFNTATSINNTSTHLTRDYKNINEFLVEHSLPSSSTNVNGGAI